MRHFFSAIAVILSTAAYAATIENPDYNIRWMENGAGIIATSGNTSVAGEWRSNSTPPMQIAQAPDGGFSVYAPTSRGSTVLTRVPLTREFPYMVLAVSDVDPTPGYRAWAFTTRVPRRIVSGAAPQTPAPGIYIYNLFDGVEAEPEQSYFDVQFYLYELKMTFAYWKLVKQPDCLIEVTSPAFIARKEFGIGDTLNFQVMLKDPAEDVGLRLYNGRNELQLNSQSKIQLKALDEEGKIWSAEVKVESLFTSRAVEYKTNSISVKAVILGGAIKLPVWTPIACPFNPGDKK